MMKAAVFASGSGTNLEELLKHAEDGSLKVEIPLVICDKENAFARQRARNHGVTEYWINPKDFENKEAYETAILKILKENGIDLIILSGYMRYIGTVLLNAYDMRIINIHPAYLPEFPGGHAIRDAFEAGVGQTGVTVHFVDAGVDTGPIIGQERVIIDPSWSLEELETAVHAKEYDLFWRVINQAASTLEEGTL